MRFRPPAWIGVLYGTMAAFQLLLVPGKWPWLHAIAGALGIVGTIIHFSIRTALDEDGIVLRAGLRHVRYRWAEITFLGRRRHHDRNLVVVLANGKRRGLPNVPAAAYPAIRDRSLGSTSLRENCR